TARLSKRPGARRCRTTYTGPPQRRPPFIVPRNAIASTTSHPMMTSAATAGRLFWLSLRWCNRASNASVRGLCYPSLTTAFLAPRRVDFATRLYWLHYLGKAGTVACRTFMLLRFSGWLFHLDYVRRPSSAECFLVLV